MATERVLSTAELLEIILLHLDLRTLLTAAQRTCRYWNSLIRDSPSLQKYLYFIPDDNVSKSWNPLLAELFPTLFSLDGASPARFSWFSFANWDIIKYPDKIAAYDRKEASWRRMLIQQPPMSGFVFFNVVSGRLQSQSIIKPRKLEYSQSHDVVRMETLFEFVVTRGPLRYEQQICQRVFWACSPPEEYPAWSQNSGIAELFKQATAQCDLVVYQISVRGYMRYEPYVTEDEKMRRLILSSHAELSQESDPETYDVIDVEGDL